MKAPIYINWGRFVADCPAPGCTDAIAAEPGRKTATCAAGHRFDLDWDDGAAAAMTALGERLSDKRRNWFPRDHPRAVTTGQPHGQSPDELRAEAEIGENADAASLADKRATALAAVRDLDIPLADVLAALKGT